MTQEQAAETVETYGLKVPPKVVSHRAAQQRLARTFRRDELIWLLDERYDAPHSTWLLEVMRAGAGGRWMRQRYQYDGQAEALYFLGEMPLSDQQFRTARASMPLFPVAQLQDQPED